MDNTPKSFQILCLDGGGIKGLFSAAVLATLENDLDIKIEDHFDLIAGTSTGGIIALGLGLGLRPIEIVEFYLEHGNSIFDNQGFKGTIKNLQHIFRPKYRAEPLEAALKTVFKERILADSTKRLIIPATNLDTNDAYLFKTPHHEKLKRDWKVPMWQIARSASAAPTFFQASTHVGHVRLIDGAIWCNSPVQISIAEAIGTLNVPLSAIKVFSLGTTAGMSHQGSLENAGLLQWAKPILEIMMSLQVKSAHAQANNLIGEENVCRLNPITPMNLFALDKASAQKLQGWASTHSRKISPEFSEKFLNHTAAPYQPLYPNAAVKS